MDLEIPLLRTIFYLFNRVEAGPTVPHVLALNDAI